MTTREISTFKGFSCSVVGHGVVVRGEVISEHDERGLPVSPSQLFKDCSGQEECRIFSNPDRLATPTGCPFYDSFCSGPYR